MHLPDQKMLMRAAAALVQRQQSRRAQLLAGVSSLASVHAADTQRANAPKPETTRTNP